MSPTALLMSIANAALAGLALAGLLRRGRSAGSAVLPLYLALLVLERPPIWFWPERFYTWSYWLWTDLIDAALRCVLAVEFLRLVLGRLPLSRRKADGTALLILGMGLVLSLQAPTPTPGRPEWIFFQADVWAGHVSFLAGWLFAALLLLALWYGVPLERIHREVAGGLLLLGFLHAFAPELEPLDAILGRNTLPRIVYTGMLLVWTRAAWSPDEPPLLGPAALRVLQPWRLA